MKEKTIKASTVKTNDGSFTLRHPLLGATYHSTHGAVQESMHVFIRHGLLFVAERQKNIKILEMGFGSGLNALLSRFAVESQLPAHALDYEGIEAYPLALETIAAYPLPPELSAWHPAFLELHQSPWGQAFRWGNQMTVKKHHTTWQEFPTDSSFDLVYYDAFAPSTQSELWDAISVQKLYALTRPGSVVVTYCAQGAFKRFLKAQGFQVEALPGPPGKREMTRAIRL